jgi:hypothetical protein
MCKANGRLSRKHSIFRCHHKNTTIFISFEKFHIASVSQACALSSHLQFTMLATRCLANPQLLACFLSKSTSNCKAHRKDMYCKESSITTICRKLSTVEDWRMYYLPVLIIALYYTTQLVFRWLQCWVSHNTRRGILEKLSTTAPNFIIAGSTQPAICKYQIG